MCLGEPLARRRQDRAFRLGCQGRHISSSFPLALAAQTLEEPFLVFCLTVGFWAVRAPGSPPCPTENQLRQPPGSQVWVGVWLIVVGTGFWLAPLLLLPGRHQQGPGSWGAHGFTVWVTRP